jgi:hypothetical protein
MSVVRVPLDVSQTSIAQKKKILEYATDVRKFEVERFWQRSIFFWGFIGAAFVAYAQSVGKGDLAFLVACFGFLCSIAWTLQNRGSKYWYEAWEAKVESVEKEVLGAHLFSNHEPIQRKGLWGARTFSVTKLTIALSDFTALTWIALAVRAFPLDKVPTVPEFSVIAAVVTIAYVGLLFTCRQS